MMNNGRSIIIFKVFILMCLLVPLIGCGVSNNDIEKCAKASLKAAYYQDSTYLGEYFPPIPDRSPEEINQFLNAEFAKMNTRMIEQFGNDWLNKVKIIEVNPNENLNNSKDIKDNLKFYDVMLEIYDESYDYNARATIAIIHDSKLSKLYSVGYPTSWD